MSAPKGARINIRVSQAEHGAIERRARAAGLGISEYIRRAALSDSDRPVIRTQPVELHKLLVQMKRAGNNLNQLAREINTHHRLDRVECELQTTLSSVSKAAADVSEFLAGARQSI